MYVKQQNPHGGDIYSNRVTLDLSSNINPFGSPDPVIKAIIDSAADSWRYPDPYCRELREKIAREENVPSGWILCGNGAAELIYAYAYSLPQDCPVLIVSPAFSEYGAALEAAGIETADYILSEEEGFRLTDRIFRTDLSAYSAIFICTPANPTGIAADPGLLRDIADTGIRVFCDMCFLDLTDSPDRYDIPSLLASYRSMTVLRSFTKSYSMAGVRLGYAICPDPGMIETMSSKTQCWNVSSVAQAAGIAALDCTGWLRDSVAEIATERARITEELRSLGIEVWPGEANYLLFRSRTDLYAEMLKKGILIRDCSNYAGLGPGFFRIAVRTEAENDTLISAIREVMNNGKS